MADCTKNLIHAVGECQDCGQEFNAKNAEGLAAQHADKYGHTVKVETGYTFTAKPGG